MRLLFTGSLVSLLLLTAAVAQEDSAPAGQRAGAGAAPRQRPPADSYSGPTEFPKEMHDLMVQHFAKAVKLAGTDLFQDMTHRCVISPVFNKRVAGIQFNGKITPTKIFDNLYSVGQNEVSSQALTTSDGIILFDTLNSEDEAKNLLVPNLVAVGLKPENIKYIVISHEHGDHYGGARYLQQTYHAKVVASQKAWEVMQAAQGRGGAFGATPVPDKDMAITADSQSISLGNTTVKFYLTPGHTEGDMSAIYKVTDNGAPHVVGYFGGTGGGRDAPTEREQIASLERWKGISSKAGVDVNITNHPLHSESLEKEYLLRYRAPGEANPFVLGKARYQRYIAVQQECAYIQLARLGFAQ